MMNEEWLRGKDEGAATQGVLSPDLLIDTDEGKEKKESAVEPSQPTHQSRSALRKEAGLRSVISEWIDHGDHPIDTVSGYAEGRTPRR